MKFFNDVKMDQVVATIESKDNWGRNMLRTVLTGATDDAVVDIICAGINPSFNKEVALRLTLEGYAIAHWNGNDGELALILTKIQNALDFVKPTMTLEVWNRVMTDTFKEYVNTIDNKDMVLIIRQSLYSTKLSFVRDNKSVIGYKMSYQRFVEYLAYYISKYFNEEE